MFQNICVICVIAFLTGCVDAVSLDINMPADAYAQSGDASLWFGDIASSDAATAADVGGDSASTDSNVQVDVPVCQTTTDCDDGEIITVDSCVGGVCQHTKSWGLKAKLKMPDPDTAANVAIVVPMLMTDGTIKLGDAPGYCPPVDFTCGETAIAEHDDTKNICGAYALGLEVLFYGIYFKLGATPDKFQNVADKIEVFVIYFVDGKIVKEVPLETVPLSDELAAKWPTPVISLQRYVSVPAIAELCKTN